jgi:hypothetical protein
MTVMFPQNAPMKERRLLDWSIGTPGKVQPLEYVFRELWDGFLNTKSMKGNLIHSKTRRWRTVTRGKTKRTYWNSKIKKKTKD